MLFHHKRSSVQAPAAGARILVIRLSALGDVLHATTVVHKLRELRPDLDITWLVSPPADVLLRYNPDIDHLLVWDRRPIDRASASHDWRTVVRELRVARQLLHHQQFDIVLDIQGLFLTGLLARFTGAPRRIGIHERHEGNPLFMTEMAPDIASPHKVKRYFTALAPLGIGPEAFEPCPVLRLPPELDSFAAGFWAEHGISCGDAARPLLLVCLRTTWPDKHWPPQKFAAALAPLPENIQIVFIGSRGDTPYIEQARAAITRPTSSIAGTTGLLELAALMKSADLLLTCDTGPLYMAEAVGLPTLSLWGPTAPSIYGPLSPGHHFIESPSACRSCCRTRCRKHTNECINAIDPAIVTRKLKELLG